MARPSLSRRSGCVLVRAVGADPADSRSSRPWCWRSAGTAPWSADSDARAGAESCAGPCPLPGDGPRTHERVWRNRLGEPRASGGELAGIPDRVRRDRRLWAHREGQRAAAAARRVPRHTLLGERLESPRPFAEERLMTVPTAVYLPPLAGTRPAESAPPNPRAPCRSWPNSRCRRIVVDALQVLFPVHPLASVLLPRRRACVLPTEVSSLRRQGPPGPGASTTGNQERTSAGVAEKRGESM